MPETAKKAAAKAPKQPQKAEKPKAKGEVAIAPQNAQEPVKKKLGRPTMYTQHMANLICLRIAEGESLREIVKTEGMPERATIYEWLLKKPDFADQYARAREEQADTLADEIIAIADEQPEVIEVKDRDGNTIDHKLDNAFLQWQKNRIDARKWTAMKLKPKKYGERVALAGDADNPVKIEAEVQAETLLSAVLKNVELKKQADD
jgi:hypothetical protein